MKVKKIPMRMCLGCRQMKPKKEMIRIVKMQDGIVKLDATGKASGRGAYVCKNQECLAACVKSKMLNKAFEMQVDETLYGQLREELDAIGSD